MSSLTTGPATDADVPTSSAHRLDHRSENPRDAECEERRTFLGAPWPLGWKTIGVLGVWCLVVIAVFTAIGEIIVRSPIDDADQALAREIVSHRTATGNDLAPWGSGLAETIVKIIATTVIVAIMFAVWRRWRDPLVVAVSLIFEATAFMVTTTITARPRPDVEQLQDSPVNSSFPSGHVAAATCYLAIALVISRRLRSTWAKVAIWAAPVLITIVVAAARLYQGMHHVSDVVAGVLLGVISVVIVDRVIPRDLDHGADVAADGSGVKRVPPAP